MKEPRNYATLYSCTVSRVTSCSYAVANFITHTGQINYFRFALCLGYTAGLHSYFCGASGYGALAILWWQSGRQQVSVGRRSGDPPKTSPICEISRTTERGYPGGGVGNCAAPISQCRLVLPRPSVKLLVSQGSSVTQERYRGRVKRIV